MAYLLRASSVPRGGFFYVYTALLNRFARYRAARSDSMLPHFVSPYLISRWLEITIFPIVILSAAKDLFVDQLLEILRCAQDDSKSRMTARVYFAPATN